MIKTKSTLIEKVNLKNFYLIAEIGNNHEGSFSKAKKLILEAKKSGADAVKFQFINPSMLVPYKDVGRFKQLNKYLFSLKEFKVLKKICKKNNIDFFSTIFDIKKLNNFSKIQNYFKISSGDNNFYDLLKEISKFKKPIMISTGMLSQNELKKLIKKIRMLHKLDFRKKNISLMHCVSSYPCKNEDLNLSFISKLKKYEFIPGYSDHSLGINGCVQAFSLGAKIIEKHFTLNELKKSKFRDHKHSATPSQFKKLRKKIEQIIKMNGNGIKKIEKGERYEIIKSRRSLHASKNINKGDTLTKYNTVFLRPDGEIKPSQNFFYGKKLDRKIFKHEQIKSKYILK